MARSNRRRIGNETGEGSVNNTGRIGAGAENARNAAQNAGNVNNVGGAAAAGAAGAQVGLDAVLAMLAQVLERLHGVAVPPVVPPVAEEVVQDVGNAPPARVPSYLKVMEHMQKLGIKFFLGNCKPVEADQWIDRMERNFLSIHCPLAYQKDIAVHYLDGDAHI